MVSRAYAVGVALAFLAAASVAIAKSPPIPKADPAQRRVVGIGQISYGGLGPERWARKYRREHRAALWLRHEVDTLRARLAHERRVLLQRPSVAEAINLAAAVYGYGSTLWRKARCETGGSFSPTSYNPSGASGLFQFLGSTWRSTPFAGFSVWSPYANALAAGWMHANGRGGEWTCR